MKPAHPYRAIAVCGAVLFAVVSSLAPRLCAQEAAAPSHTGVPQDWSQHHIVFTRDGLARHPEIMNREPRVLHQAMQRWVVPDFGAFHGAEPLPTSAANSGLHRDWSKSLAGLLSAPMFPVKFSFDPNAPPDCTKDYVVFGLSKVGVTGGQANLVALNNLYVNSTGTGFCPGTAPNVLFAYNTSTVAGLSGGRISTSPILSLDGKKIGFVESVPGASPKAIFHVLTWAPGQGAIGNAAAPASMTSLTFSPSFNSTTSSPWIDFEADTVYLGTDNGAVYKITGVFRGTPTLAGAPWPATVSTGHRLTPPVLDAVLGLLMVGSADGILYQIDPSVGAVVNSAPVGLIGGTNQGIFAPPIVDVTNGTTFAVSANDGTSAVLVEFDTASLTELTRANLGLGATLGTPVKLYQPAFSNDYYTDPSTGVVSLCGTGASDTSPWQYEFGFTGSIMNTTTVTGFPVQLLTSTAARCTGWTEFFNPNVGTAGTDFFFFGLTQDCTAAGTAGGCVEALSSDPTIPTATATVRGGPTGITADNYSIAAEASSIYLMEAQLGTAHKFTQSGLQ